LVAVDRKIGCHGSPRDEEAGNDTSIADESCRFRGGILSLVEELLATDARGDDDREQSEDPRVALELMKEAIPSERHKQPNKADDDDTDSTIDRTT